jgi:CBS domain-containing protein
MKVSEIMSRPVRIASPSQSICHAAQMMAEEDIGVLPVGENDRLVGMITDRDIALRAVAQHKSPDTSIREVMSSEVLYCMEDDDIEDVARNMGEQQIRRLPVLDAGKRLVGIVALSDLAQAAEPGEVGQAIAEISEPGGQHSQTLN